MPKYVMNFASVPERIIGTTKLSTKSTYHGKCYESMTDQERLAFREVFISHGADDVIFDPESSYVYNILWGHLNTAQLNPFKMYSTGEILNKKFRQAMELAGMRDTHLEKDLDYFYIWSKD